MRRQVGERIDLDDDEGWFRSEAWMAWDVFDRCWRHQRCLPEKTKLPPQLLDRAAATAGPDVDPKAIDADWRRWIVDQPQWMQDMPMMSVMSYARQLAEENRQASG